MVIEFTRPEMANAIIYAGFLWEGSIHTCQLYDRSCRIKQCLRCYNYGHIGTQCSASQTCGYCTGGHESRDCTVRNAIGFTPKCAVCKGPHTAWNSACPARQKELQRVEKAKQVRNHYWPTTPPKRTPSATNYRDEHGPTPPITTSDSTSGPTRRSQTTGTHRQPSQEPRTSRRTRSQPQPTPTQPIAQTQPLVTQVSATPPEAEVQDAFATIAPVAVMAPTETQEDELFVGDEWLQNLDLDWLGTPAIAETPALSTIPDDQLQAPPQTLGELRSGRRGQLATLEDLPPAQRGCSCVEHERLYNNWPTRDAELTIGTCMKECPYCGECSGTASELRKHIRRVHWRRNLIIRKEKMGIKNIAPGWRPIPPTTASNAQSTTTGTQV